MIIRNLFCLFCILSHLFFFLLFLHSFLFPLFHSHFNSWLTESLKSKQFWLNNLSIETKLENKSRNCTIIISQGHGKSEGPRAYAVSMEHVILDIYRYFQWHRIVLSALLKFRPKACITSITNQTIINMPKSSVRTPEISTGSTKLPPIYRHNRSVFACLKQIITSIFLNQTNMFFLTFFEISLKFGSVWISRHCSYHSNKFIFPPALRKPSLSLTNIKYNLPPSIW